MLGKNFYELPTNADLEQILAKNLDTTIDLEMKEVKTGDGTKLFPFWVPVKDCCDTFTDYKSYLDEKQKALRITKKEDNVGIVQPKDVEKNYEDGSLLDKINALIQNQNKELGSDKTGVVKAVAEKITPKKEVPKQKEPKVSVDLVGVVKPKDEMVKQTVVDITNGSEKAKGDNVGVVKAKDEIKPQAVTIVSKPTEKNNDKMVGVVKPKSDIKANPTDINFDRFKVDHINTAKKK